MTTLDIESTYFARDVLCLAVSGEIDMESTDALNQAIQEALGIDGLARLVVNMQRTSFLDSTGLLCLLLAHQAASERGITFRIMNASPIVRVVLEETGAFELLAENV